MKRVALYARVSTSDQNPETQLVELRAIAKQRGFEIVEEFIDHGISGARRKRPALDRLLSAVRHAKVDIVMVWAFDRMARSVQHFLEVVDEFNHLKIEFLSLHENVDTGGPMGRLFITIVGAMAELERSLIKERVRAGMHRARLEGQRLGRPRLDIDAKQILLDRAHGMSLAEIASAHHISRTTVRRVLGPLAPKSSLQTASQLPENTQPETAA
jgi:DNA invertase Pin-like site-specific DNA recombinase